MTWSRRQITITITFVVLLALALYPLFDDPLSSRLNFGIYALAYVTFALGLNIVVGFAGLLDLGYVAFFAIGAYSVGWFASGHFAYINNQHGLRIGVPNGPTT